MTKDEQITEQKAEIERLKAENDRAWRERNEAYENRLPPLDSWRHGHSCPFRLRDKARVAVLNGRPAETGLTVCSLGVWDN